MADFIKIAQLPEQCYFKGFINMQFAIIGRSANIFLALALPFLASCSTVPTTTVTPAAPLAPLKIALALGGGAARGFAHVGVIKALEAQGIVPDIIVGTSAGSVVGALYAAGYNGFELQQVSMKMDENQVSDWSLPNRGMIKGEALQDFINRAVHNLTLEKLKKVFAVVATDLSSGEMIVFRTGNTGMAVRASSSVPGIFQPVSINGREYVDGGLVSPVPVRVARSLGADFVIAVDISDKPQHSKTESSIDVLLQTFNIMGQTISRNELKEADLVIRPVTPGISSTDFKDKHQAVLQGEKAVADILIELKDKLAKRTEGRPSLPALEGAAKNSPN
jgi:NTE family protein